MERKDHFGRCRGTELLMTMLFSQLIAILSKVGPISDND